MEKIGPPPPTTPTQRILLSVMVGAFMCLVLAVAQTGVPHLLAIGSA
jgi:hypothetical protein